ncbi:hypothetical protein EDD35_2713 [Amycolatopsis thermoflava]|uniref:Uncharacterized protein n=1 Tax=Amycolatopsis thermoflava TaxID=84480 RepID=A0A3N2GVS3_9PSEU|nr:hypothetical protein EDD35_2713 [Amycolatopsis thermoflava]
MVGCQTQRGLRPWLKVMAPVSGDGMTTQLGLCAQIKGVVSRRGGLGPVVLVLSVW